MTTLLRILLCGLVVLAPWLCGAVTARPHFLLGAVLIGIALAQFIQNLFRTSNPRSLGIPTALFVPIGFLLIGGWQLFPWGDWNPLAGLHSTPLSDLIPALVATPEFSGFARGLRTLSPNSTQLILAQIALVTLAFWLSFELFEDSSSRRWLYLTLALNGLAVAGFGIAQQLTWNGKLFWTIPLRYGGSPFGPFVNRNNGAGYLLLTFACAIASLMAAWFPFGLGRTPVRSGPWRARLSGLLLRLMGNLTPAVLLSAFAVAVIAIGILASLSRAGVVGLLAAVLVLIPAMNRWKTHMLVLVVALVSLAYAGLIGLGQIERIAERLESTKNMSAALQGRVEHWKEITSLIQDFPTTGSGWGTYSLVNPVYVTRSQDTWFQHAENQYIEILAEAGVAGLGLFLAGFLLITYASARALRDDQDGRLLATGLCGLLSTAAISTISLTDFSLSIGSIVFTFAVLAGSVYASYAKTRGVSHWIFVATGRPHWRFLVSVGLLLTSGLALDWVRAVAEVETVVNAIPLGSASPTLETPECDKIIARLYVQKIRHPQQPEIYAALGELYIYRYRRMMYDELRQQPEAKALDSRPLWATTHLERLDAVITDLRVNGDSIEEQHLREHPAVQQNLPLAWNALNECLQLNPLHRGVSMPHAWLTHILNESSTPAARDLAMFVGTSDAEVLFQTGLLSQRISDPESNVRSWKRCLEISDRWSTKVWNEATLTRDESETLTLYPDRLGSLLAIAELPSSLKVRREILARCKRIASKDPQTTALSMAQLYVLLDDFPHAADAYMTAIQASPYDIELRLEASVILERAGRMEDARIVVGVARALAPARRDAKDRFEWLIARERENEKTTPENGNSLRLPPNR